MDRELGPPSLANVMGAAARDIGRLTERSVWRKPIHAGGTSGAVIVPGDSGVASVPATSSLSLDAGAWSTIASARASAIVVIPPVVIAFRFRLAGGSEVSEQTITVSVLDEGADVGVSLAINFALAAPGSVSFSTWVTAIDPNNRTIVDSAQLTFVDLMAFSR